MRVTFIIPDLGPGGAQHALVLLARRWAERGRGVIILTYDDGSRPSFYDLDPSISHVPLAFARDSKGALDAVANNLRRMRALRRELQRLRPDLVVSFIDQTNVLTLLSAEGLGVPVVVVEQSDPRLYPIPRAWARLRLLTYGRARRVVLLSARDAAYFPPRLRRRVVAIPNPFEPPQRAAGGDVARDGATDRPMLIAVGRLHRDKGFDLLLRAFALLRGEHPEWRLTVLGEGGERARLEALRDELNLGGRVSFPGRVRDPYIHLRHATLFALPSRVEGFPLALCEALACGLPAICADSGGGVRDIVEVTGGGLLVPNEDAESLARGLGQMMSNEALRRRLARRAPQVLKHFSPEKTFEAWESLLREVAGER